MSEEIVFVFVFVVGDFDYDVIDSFVFYGCLGSCKKIGGFML